MQTLRIGYLSTMYHTSHLLKKLRWVETLLHGEPEWSLFGTGPAMVEAFQAGALDAGYIGLPPAMIAIGRGLPIKCIAGGHVEGTVMIGPQDLVSARTAADIPAVLQRLDGKKIGSPARGSIHDVIIRWLLKKHGCTAAEVVNYPWADLIPEAIREHEIDAAVGTPQLAVLARRFYDLDIVIAPQFLWPFNPSYGLVVHQALLGQHRLLERLVELHEQACNLIRLKPAEAADTVARAVKVVDAAFIRDVFSVSPRYCASLPPQYINATMAFVPALKKMGYLQDDLTEDAVFDKSFITAVHPGPHHYSAAS